MDHTESVLAKKQQIDAQLAESNEALEEAHRSSHSHALGRLPRGRGCFYLQLRDGLS